MDVHVFQETGRVLCKDLFDKENGVLGGLAWGSLEGPQRKEEGVKPLSSSRTFTNSEEKSEICHVSFSVEEWSCHAQGSSDSNKNRSSNMSREAGASVEQRSKREPASPGLDGLRGIQLQASWTSFKRPRVEYWFGPRSHILRGTFPNTALVRRALSSKTDLEAVSHRIIEGTWKVKFDLASPKGFKRHLMNTFKVFF